MTIEITILISVISVSAAIFFGIKGAKRADVNDIEERAKKNAEIIFKLDEALTLMRKMQEELKEQGSRISKDEKDTEMLSMRYADLERRVEKLEGK